MSNNTCFITISNAISQKVSYAVYHIGAPTYFVLGLIGHSLLLLALYKQSKVQPAYMYQVFRAVAETVEVGTRSLYLLGFSTNNYYYAWIWYGAHLATPVSNSVVGTSLLLSVSMVADRVLALHKPALYRSLNHKRYQIIAVIASVSLSFSASAFDCFRMYVGIDEGNRTYKLVSDKVWMTSTLAYVLALYRAVLLTVSLCVLICLSIVLSFLFRSSFVKKCGQVINDKKQEERKQSEKTMTLLALLECFFNIVGVSFLVANNVFVYGLPKVLACFPIWFPVLDGTMMIVDVADFYTVLLVSKQFRKILRKAVTFEKTSLNINAVTPTAAVKVNGVVKVDTVKRNNDM